MTKRSARELEIFKTNVLNHPEPLPLIEDDDSFLTLARRHARIKMMFEQNPAEDKAIIADLTGLAKVPPHLEARFRWEVLRLLMRVGNGGYDLEGLWGVAETGPLSEKQSKKSEMRCMRSMIFTL